MNQIQKRRSELSRADSNNKAASNAKVWIPADTGTATVECDVVDGTVRTITVRCNCGCVTELVCEYDEPTAKTA